MKIIYLFALLLFSPLIKAITPITLTEALKQHKVIISIRGVNESEFTTREMTNHYGPCMAIEVTNNTAQALSIQLDNGYKLEPTNPDYQTMITTSTTVIDLTAHQKKDRRIFAMCIEHSDRSLDENMQFALGQQATGYLLALAKQIDAWGYQNGTAQDAVWCLTNDEDINNISNTDDVMVSRLKTFVAKAKNITEGVVFRIGREPAVVNRDVMVIRPTYSGNVTFNLKYPAKILVALYDESGQPTTIYVNNETRHEGAFTYSYNVTSAELNGKKHYLRMFKNGRLEKEVALDPVNN